MNNRWKVSLVLLFLSLGVSRGWEAFTYWQTGKTWGFEAALSLFYLIAAGVLWREHRRRR